jgi:hypothetical protein
MLMLSPTLVPVATVTKEFTNSSVSKLNFVRLNDKINLL